MFEGIIAELVKQVLVWAQQYPVVASVLMVIGVLRVVMKPTFTFLREFVLATPGTGDDELLAKVEASKPLQWALYILDWFGSVKLPVQAELEKQK